MDWFRSAQRLLGDNAVEIITDQVEGEGYQRLLRPEEHHVSLLGIDRLLLRGQSAAGNAWRNVVKMFLLPYQARLCRRLLRERADALVHAHSAYYIVIAALAKARFIATPQGSEVLVRPSRSRWYRAFITFGLKRAEVITVDSIAMATRVQSLTGKVPVLIQNGIDVAAVGQSTCRTSTRELLLSIRGISPNYQVPVLLSARNTELTEVRISLCAPFAEKAELERAKALMMPEDRYLGRLERTDLYDLLWQARLVCSIPISDSSPRSVYEAIFAGAAVAVSPSEWVEAMPRCMRARVIVVDVESGGWLRSAWQQSADIVAVPYVPSEEALDRFDQMRSMERVLSLGAGQATNC